MDLNKNFNKFCCNPCCCPTYIKGPTGPTGPTGESGKFTGIQMQYIIEGYETLEQFEVVKFNTLINNLSSDITYDQTTGIFQINKIGNFVVDWWVGVDGSGGTTEMSLSVLANGSIVAESMSPNVTSQVNGTALIRVSNVPTSVALINSSTTEISFVTYPTKANITIFSN